MEWKKKINEMIPLCVLSRSAWGEPADCAQPAVALGLAGFNLPFFPYANIFPFFPSANLTFTRVIRQNAWWAGRGGGDYLFLLSIFTWECLGIH